MSTDTEVLVGTVELANDPVEVTGSTSVDACRVPSQISVEGSKQEYSIVGDGLYASVSANEAPTWLTGLIDSVVSTSVTSSMTGYDTLVQDVRSAIDSIDIAQNTFTTATDVTTLADGIIANEIETLNASTAVTYATKTELSTAVATTNEALAQDISNLEVSLNNTIDSQISNVQTALATETGALASDISALEASYVDQESGLAAAATAVSGLQTYVGLAPNGVPNDTGLIDSVRSLSEFYVNLENEVTGADGYVNTSLANLQLSSEAYADSVESKFAYNSTIKLGNGFYYNAGFGLKAVGSTGTGTGTKENPYNSEFWINAEKFKFTNTNQTGTATPFSIDASGTSPEITFNGKVTFSNVTDTGNIATLDEVVASTYGAVPAYSNNDPSTISFDTTEKALRLKSLTDPSIGLAFPAFRVGTVEEEQIELSIKVKADAASTLGVGGLYLYIAEYDSDLPTNKSHVSALASTSDPSVVEATRNRTWLSGGVLSTDWRVFTYTYKPTTTAKWASIVVYRWTSGGYQTLFIKDYQRSSGVTDITTALGPTGTTVIDGGRIITGTIEANRIDTDNLVAKHIDVGSVAEGFRLSSEAAGTGTDPTIYGSYITGGTIEGTTITGTTITGGTIEGTTITGGTITSGSATMTDGNFIGLGFNGIRFKVGTFKSTKDGTTRVYFNAPGTDSGGYQYETEGMVWATSSSGTPVVAYGNTTRYKNFNQGQVTAPFNVLLGAAVAHMGPSGSIRDANNVKISSNQFFTFDRDDAYNDTEYFSYIAWGF